MVEGTSLEVRNMSLVILTTFTRPNPGKVPADALFSPRYPLAQHLNACLSPLVLFANRFPPLPRYRTHLGIPASVTIPAASWGCPHGYHPVCHPAPGSVPSCQAVVGYASASVHVNATWPSYKLAPPGQPSAGAPLTLCLRRCAAYALRSAKHMSGGWCECVG